MPEVTVRYDLAALVAKGRAALLQGVTQADEHLVGEQQAAAPVATGTLRGSIHVDHITAGGDTVEAMNATGGESSGYAIFVHEGTGPHVIEGHPYLSWPGAEHPVKVVHHPGTRANRFMSDPLLANVALYEKAMAAAAAGEF